jgi:hypothetical protein
MSAPIRKFDTGATRNADAGKLDYEGFLSPLVLKRYGEYMNSHRKQADGTMRDSDNWQKGIPLTVYIKSAWRHFIDVWAGHRGHATPDDIETNLCALIFNASGYLHERLKSKAALDELVSIGQAMGDYGKPTAKQLYDKQTTDNRYFDRDYLDTWQPDALPPNIKQHHCVIGMPPNCDGHPLRHIQLQTEELRRDLGAKQ